MGQNVKQVMISLCISIKYDGLRLPFASNANVLKLEEADKFRPICTKLVTHFSFDGGSGYVEQYIWHYL